ncbi:MAG: aminotransferase class I/II-fold pyridoxal phosphate-dependent enzyme [Acidimicrobiia bacterium]|nr:aminotransferase class I/II-fold pyridoxal phosphate-dependent enzyme [Acidimicrobiia bacterium]
MVSRRLAPFGVTIFTEMTALAERHGAIDLGQGYPSWDGPPFIKDAAARAMAAGGLDQYPPMAGLPDLRRAVADRYAEAWGRPVDPDVEVTITSGCTEALAAAFLGLINPGDEVIIIDPAYDAYPVGAALAGAEVRRVALRAPGFRLDTDELAAAFSDRTRAIVVNTPHNPTGRVLDQTELTAIARLCVAHDTMAFVDEVYEYMVYEGIHHHLATMDGMADRTVTLSSLGKTFSLTGWKVGWAVASAELSRGVRAAHQYLTFTVPTPVQAGAIAALRGGQEVIAGLADHYRSLRDLLCAGLAEVGFVPHVPQGSYFVMADHTAFDKGDDRQFCTWMIEKAGVAAIPPGVFYADPADGHDLVRFAFCKDEALLTSALERLRSATG